MNSHNSIFPVAEWQARSNLHLRTVLPFTAGFRTRRACREPHPIYDFLFTYYRFTSKKLERWHPGFGAVLETSADYLSSQFRADPHYEENNGGLTVSAAAIGARKLEQLLHVQSICRTILQRNPRFACFGLHEWAIVYRSPDIRHSYPLRMTADEIAEFLDSTRICCSHFDAFRFFSPAGRKLNVIQPESDSRLDFEQGGCLHANMDLYKWAFKLSPLVSSDLLRRCFMLALEAREIDMRASPYDFTDLGFAPIPVETESGRQEYVGHQTAIAEQARLLRTELLNDVDRILNSIGDEGCRLVRAGTVEAVPALSRSG